MQLLSMLFGCRHSRRTFPQTRVLARNSFGRITARGGKYTACLDCGAEIPYEMPEEAALPIRTVQEVAH